MNKTLFSRSFTLMLVGQIVSLLGNALLRFALSLYILDLTGSASVFGGVLAASMLPTILLSPVGGVLADRIPRQRIMYILDFLTAIGVWNFALFGRNGSTLPPPCCCCPSPPFRPAINLRSSPLFPCWSPRRN